MLRAGAYCTVYRESVPERVGESKGFMQQAIIYRPFEVRDQNSARQLILHGLGEHFGFIDETRNPDLDNIQENYIATGATFLVAQLDERIVGTGALLEAEATIGQIVRMSVDRAYRRHGIGKTLMVHLLEVARQRKYTQVQLETNNDWYDVIDFYKSVGFVVDEWTPHNVYMSIKL